MEKKTTQSLFSRVDESLGRLTQHWEDLKKMWRNDAFAPGELDRSFYKFIEAFLACEGIIDREMHAHTLTSGDDPELSTVRQIIGSLQNRLSKMDDPRQKQQAIDRLVQILDTKIVYEV